MALLLTLHKRRASATRVGPPAPHLSTMTTTVNSTYSSPTTSILMSITCRNLERDVAVSSKEYPYSVDQEDCPVLVIRSTITMAMERLAMYRKRQACQIPMVTMDSE